MATEDPKGWIRESELLLIRLKQNAEAVAAQTEATRKLAIVLRDLVYIELTKVGGDHKETLHQHLATLDDICAEGPVDE